jgi:DNA-binding transcriptional LysR family regulator
MTLHQLRVFTTVAEFKSFTKAAEKLEVRQPSVTLLVRSLQQELGAKLFERLGNNVHLTRAGEELFNRVQEILAKVDILKDALDEIQGLKKGKLSVGGSAMAGASFLPAAIQAFQNQHSGVDVFLRIEPSKVLEQMLLKGEIDIGILGQSSQSPHLLSRPFREDKVIVIAPPNHPLTKKRSVPLEVLAKERFVVGKKGESPIRDGVEAIFAEKGLTLVPTLEVTSSFGSRDIVRTAIADGLGIGFTYMCQAGWEIKSGRLKVLRVPELNLTRTQHIVVHKSRQGSPMVRAFNTFLKNYKERPATRH